jgi:hypothetical protein
MKRSVIFAAVIYAFMVMPAAADWVRSGHVVVLYAGIGRPYAEAIARIVETARSAAIEQFGFNMPATIRVVVTVAPQKQLKLCTNGRDGISLTIRSEQDLRKPAEGGAFNIYGMCHEVGHIAMYRLTYASWMSCDAKEGWAHYLGSRLVDVVYAKEGADLWPDRYDYDSDGTRRLDDELTATADDANEGIKGHVKGAAAWKQLVEIVGDKGIAPIFWAWGRTKYDPANPAPGLGRALWFATRDQQVAAWWLNANGVLIDMNRANRSSSGRGNGRANARR